MIETARNPAVASHKRTHPVGIDGAAAGVPGFVVNSYLQTVTVAWYPQDPKVVAALGGHHFAMMTVLLSHHRAAMQVAFQTYLYSAMRGCAVQETQGLFQTAHPLE